MFNSVLARSFALTIAASLMLACAERTSLSADDETGGPAPGEAFAGCMDKGDCLDDWCLHPVGEPGFCTFACGGTVDNCDPAPGGSATLTCLAVKGDEVCALDCSGDKSCPSGMRCEQIEANGEPRSICF